MAPALDRRRPVPGPGRGRVRLAAGRPHHRRARRPTGPGGERAAASPRDCAAWPPPRSLPLYLAAWLVLGLAMGAGLYDAAFATLGRLYGQGARQAITTLTLFGGFASTACWPLSAFLVSSLGWRGACLVYAALHLAVALPLYLVTLPRVAGRPGPAVRQERPPAAKPGPAAASPPSRPLFLLLAATITLGSAVSALMSVHLLSILQERGVAACRGGRPSGALVGPGAGRRPRHRDADRPLPSSDLDAWSRRPCWWRQGSACCGPACPSSRSALLALRRRDRHRIDRPGHPAPGPVRGRRLRHADGPAGHAQPSGPGRLAGRSALSSCSAWGRTAR